MRLRLAPILLAALTSLPAADGDGSATITFGETTGTRIAVPVDTRGTFVLRLRVGPGGLAVGGGVQILRRSHWDARLGDLLQTTHPAAAGHVSATTDRPGALARLVHVPRSFKDLDTLRVRIEGQALAEGDEVRIAFGDRSQGGDGIVTLPVAHQRREIFVRTDADGDGVFQRLPGSLVIDYLPGPAVRLEVLVPSEVGERERFTVTVRAEDANSNPVEVEGDIGVAAEGESQPFVLEGPRSDSGGVRSFTARGEARGVFRLVASGPGGLSGVSNPLRVLESSPTRPLVWGDLHVHTLYSDGTDGLDDNFRFGRDVAALDFMALTDHLHPAEGELRLDRMLRFGIDSGITPATVLGGWWADQLDAAERFHEPGRFVTLFAYEWSGASRIGGDHNVFLSERLSLLGPAGVGPATLDAVYGALLERDRGDNVAIVPHVGGRIGNWDFHRPEVEPVLEICSCHGHFEWFAQEALARGYRVAFIGSSDTHHGRPGYAVWQRFGRSRLEKRSFGVPGGMVAARASTPLERGTVLRALRRRRVYATTGVRIIVDYSLSGVPMGESFTTSSPPRVHLEVHGTTAIERVDLIRDRLRLATFRGTGSPALVVDHEDTSAPRGWHYYYARITQEDGELAWASPVWVNRTGPEGSERADEAPLPAWNDDGELADWVRPEAATMGPAKAALDRILEERAPGRFAELTAVRRVENRRGSYFVFFARERDGTPVRIRYFDGFAEPRLHVSPGWGDYGPIRR